MPELFATLVLGFPFQTIYCAALAYDVCPVPESKNSRFPAFDPRLVRLKGSMPGRIPVAIK